MKMRKRPPPLLIEKVKAIVKKRSKNANNSPMKLGNIMGPESPLTPQLLEGNAKFDQYLQSKIMVWHKNKQRNLSTKD